MRSKGRKLSLTVGKQARSPRDLSELADEFEQHALFLDSGIRGAALASWPLARSHGSAVSDKGLEVTFLEKCRRQHRARIYFDGNRVSTSHPKAGIVWNKILVEL